MLIEFFLYPLAGFFMKLSDDAQDKAHNNILGIMAGIICVGAIGYLSVYCSDAATIFLSILLGTLISGKVDKIGHIITLLIFLSILAIFGFPSISLLLLALCSFAAFLDEIGNDASWIENKKVIKLFFRYRLALKLMVFTLAFAGGLQLLYPGLASGWVFFQPITFLYFLLFDLAYETAGLLFHPVYNCFQRFLRICR